MKLNAVEKMVMNNPARRAVQRRYETPLLLRLGGPATGARALEIGCGQGYGATLALEHFKVDSVDAVDLDEDMVERAVRRLAGRLGVGQLAVGDATDLRAALGAGDGAYDAVFDFGTLHHLPDWRAGLAEARRVLRPGGRLYFEEVTDQALNRWVYRTFTDHPAGGHFTPAAFASELATLGFEPLGSASRMFGDFIIGVVQAR